MRGVDRRQATALLSCLSCLSCSALPLARAAPLNAGVSARDIVIGQTITLQDGKNAHGVATLDGVRLYVDALNAKGGVHGRQLTLRVLDDKNTAAQAEANAKQLIDEGAFLLFGPIEGGPSTAVAKVASAMNVPLFGPMAGPPTLRRPHLPMVFPVRAEHREEFRALMKHGAAQGKRTVAFMHADSDGGRQHLENVKLIAAELGLTVSKALPFKGDITDDGLQAMVASLASDPPDMLFNHGSPGVYQRFIAQARAAGVRTALMGVNSGSSQIMAHLGELARGMVFTQVVPSPWERKHAISREYQEATQASQRSVALSYGALEGFATAKALTLALKAVGRDLTRARLLATLSNAQFDLGGIKLSYKPGDHEGSRFVDLSLVNRDGRFMH
jgi:branched-chain amino acid transport system substrate-binding protein